MNGKLIVIEGLDGSGKATQARALAEALQAQGRDVMQITFPDYASDSSALVKMYLGGRFGSHPDDVNAYAASTFYSVDRFASYKMKWGEFYRKGGIVIADRYTTSNAVHQCSKLPQDQWDAFLDWLFDFEYNKIGIPAPDSVIYLEVDQGDEAKKDIHEKDTEYLARSQQAARHCAAALGWVTVACCHAGEMRTIQQIHEDVLRATKEILC